MNGGSLGALPKEKPPPLIAPGSIRVRSGAGASPWAGLTPRRAYPLPEAEPFSMRLRSAATARISSMWYIPEPRRPAKSLAATLPMSSYPRQR